MCRHMMAIRCVMAQARLPVPRALARTVRSPLIERSTSSSRDTCSGTRALTPLIPCPLRTRRSTVMCRTPRPRPACANLAAGPLDGRRATISTSPDAPDPPEGTATRHLHTMTAPLPRPGAHLLAADIYDAAMRLIPATGVVGPRQGPGRVARAQGLLGHATPQKRPYAPLTDSVIRTQSSCVAATPVLQRADHVTFWLFLSAWWSPSSLSPPPSRPSASRQRWARI